MKNTDGRDRRAALFRSGQVSGRAVLLVIITAAAALVAADGLSLLAFNGPLPGVLLRIGIGAIALLVTPRPYRIEVAFAILFFAGLRGCAWIAGQTIEPGFDGAWSRLQPLRVPFALSLGYLALPAIRLYRRRTTK